MLVPGCGGRRRSARGELAAPFRGHGTRLTSRNAQPPAPRLYLIDGYALIYRAFFALVSRPLVSGKGENTSAALGRHALPDQGDREARARLPGDGLRRGTSDRHVIFPAYKATREKMPDELAASLPRVRQLVEAFRIPVLELDGYEADDVIGTLAAKAVEQGLGAVIVIGDKDFYQLIRPRVPAEPRARRPAAVEESGWTWPTPAP